jgi:hypothetical protein
MKDSDKTEQWVSAAVQRHGIARVGPSAFKALVRLGFPALHEPAAFKNEDGTFSKPKYGARLMFTPYHNFSELYATSKELVARVKYTAPEQLVVVGEPPIQIQGLGTPFRDATLMAEKAGYTPGTMFMNVRSDGKPETLKWNGVKHVAAEKSDVYSGVWAIVKFSLYVSKPVVEKKIPSRLCAGFNQVLLYAADRKLGDGQSAAESFKDVHDAEAWPGTEYGAQLAQASVTPVPANDDLARMRALGFPV